MVYARGTTVEIDRSRMEIERTLKRYGADQFSYGSDDSRGVYVIQFRAHSRAVRFTLWRPKSDDNEIQFVRKGTRRPANQIARAIEQRTKERWRALLLCVKAKLESVESHIETFDEAFMPHIILPDGQTASEWLSPQIAIAYETGQMPKQLLALPAPSSP